MEYALSIHVGSNCCARFQWGNALSYTCAQNNCNAVAITDRNTVQGYLIAEDYAARKKISLIYGMTVDCLDREDRYAVTLLAKNRTGRENIFALLRLMDDRDLSQGRYVTRQQLEAHRDGLLLGASARDGQLVRAIQLRRSDAALKKAALTYDYMELALEPYDVGARLCRLSHKSGVPACAVQNATFAGGENAYYHAHQAITRYWGKSEEAVSWKKPEDLTEDFRELYILPEEREIVEKALSDNQQWVFDQIEPMPTMEELMQRGQDEFHQERMAKLRQDVQAALVKKYGPDVAPAIRERLAQELEDIDRAGAAGIIHILQEIRLALPKEKHPIMLSAFWNSFLLLYLLDVTDFDPLHQTLSPTGHDMLYIPGFYRKDQLCSIEIRLSETAHLTALEHLGKTCRSFLAGKGPTTRSSDETLLADEIARSYLGICSGEDRTTLNKNGSFYCRILSFCEERPRKLPDWQKIHLLPNMDCLPIKMSEPLPELELDGFLTGYPYFGLMSSRLATALEACQKVTGVFRTSIPLDDPAIYQELHSCRTGETLTAMNVACRIAGFGSAEQLAELADLLDVRDLHSLIRASGLSHGTAAWTDNQEPLLCDGIIAPEEVITCREDVYRYLVQRGVSSKEAAEFMSYVRKGRAAHKGFSDKQKEMLHRCGAEEWFISACRKIGYLFPEAHSLPFAVGLLQLIWYLRNAPNAAGPILLEIAEEYLRQEKALEDFYAGKHA